MNTLKTFIVDDEMPAREELKYLLSKDPRINIVGEADNLEDTLKMITKTEIDLIFLDIQINNESGVELAEKIKDRNIGVIFATAYDEYAVKAFSLNAIDYLLKPFSQERVDQSVERAVSKLLKGQKENEKVYLKKLTFWKGDKMVVVAPEDILYLSVDERKVIVETNKGTLTDAGPLQTTYEKLNPDMFVRTHRSFIVNLEKIDEVIPWFNNTYVLKIIGLQDVEIPVSRSYLQEFKKTIGLV